jgi:hypothetical protein
MPKPPNPTGRPTKYRPEYAEQARKLCERGAIDPELADFFAVSLKTICNWKVSRAGFAEALKAGKAVADDRVQASLYNRAVGYSFDSVKILATDGRVIQTPYVEHLPPDVNACRFWLVNRRRKDWQLTPRAESNDSPVDLLAQIAADAPRLVADEPGPAAPVL